MVGTRAGRRWKQQVVDTKPRAVVFQRASRKTNKNAKSKQPNKCTRWWCPLMNVPTHIYALSQTGWTKLPQCMFLFLFYIFRPFPKNVEPFFSFILLFKDTYFGSCAFLIWWYLQLKKYLHRIIELIFAKLNKFIQISPTLTCNSSSRSCNLQQEIQTKNIAKPLFQLLIIDREYFTLIWLI